MTTFGEVSWSDDVFAGEKKQTNNKDLWLRLKEGSNEIRLVTQPFQYLVHKYKKEGDSGFGQKVNCSAIHGHCPLCALGDKAKTRWLLGVISRDDGTYKILDVSFAVFGGIRNYARNTARWGDPTKYDIDIVVNKNGGATGYYSVQAIPKEPLSAADQVIKDTQVDLEDLKRRVTPPTPDMVQKRMDKIDGKVVAADTSKKSVKATPAVKVVTTAPVSLADDDELGNDFPDYNEQSAQ